MQPNFDVFDHQMKVKAAETPGGGAWGAGPPRKFQSNSQNLTKLQDLMSHTLIHTFHSKSQPYNYLTMSIASICTKRHYLRQALYVDVT